MILIIIFLTLYCTLLLIFHAGWQRAVRDRKNANATDYPLISVVIAVRNEQENINSLLHDLREQDYGNYQVILVNDHSTDNTVEAIEEHRFPNVTLIHNQGAGKKAALQTGITIANGEIIATTDADCRLSQHWLTSIQKSFYSPQIKFVFGAVAIYPGEGFFSELQSVEFSALIGSAAACSAFGAPIMCNGANLAFRKEAFENVGGYKANEHIASGDDEFLMRKILKSFPGAVKFIPYREASVRTAAQKSLITFFHQRLRWAGKWRHNTSATAVILALFIFSMQFAVLAGVVSLFISLNYSIAILLITKIVLEAAFAYRVNRFSKIPMSWFALLALQILYPFYVLAVGIFSNFVTPRWKGRSVSR